MPPTEGVESDVTARQPVTDAPAAESAVAPAKPARPDISFRRGGDEEPTLSTPVAALPQQPVEIVPAATDEFPSAALLDVDASSQQQHADDYSDDDVESVSDDELLDMEPVTEEVEPELPRK
jgi:hypothetical protein